MFDKLNGFLVNYIVIELLKSCLAGWLSVAAQKIQLDSPICQSFFFPPFFPLACVRKTCLPQDTAYNCGQTEKCQAIKQCSREMKALTSKVCVGQNTAVLQVLTV